MLELYHSEPNTFSLKPLIALHGEAGGIHHAAGSIAAALEQFAAGIPADPNRACSWSAKDRCWCTMAPSSASSFFMLEYIAEALPGPPLLPDEPFDAYRARAWGQYLAQLGFAVPVLGAARYFGRISTSSMPFGRISVLRHRTGRASGGLAGASRWHLSPAYLQTVVDRLAAPIARVEKALQGGPWLAGPAFSVADIDAYPMLCVLPDLAPALVNREATPRIAEYLERIAARDSVRAALRSARTDHPQRQFVPGIEAARWG